MKGEHYGISLQWGPNTLLVQHEAREAGADQLGGRSTTPKYKGKITVPDNPIQIADAALYLTKTQPSLGIKDPYELTRRSSTRRSACSKQQKPLIKKYWALASDEIDLFKNGDAVVGASWPYQTNTLKAAKVPVEGPDPEGGRDRLGRHVDDVGARQAPELHVQVDGVGLDAEGAGGAGDLLR